MTTEQLAQATGLNQREIQKWIDYGLLNADKVTRDGGGWQREFTQDQLERACLLRALHRKGAKLPQLARADLAGLAGKGFVVFDGNELCTCRDAVAAIATVVKAKRPCTAVDLSAIRTAVE